jgi:hypothetical protein
LRLHLIETGEYRSIQKADPPTHCLAITRR